MSDLWPGSTPPLHLNHHLKGPIDSVGFDPVQAPFFFVKLFNNYYFPTMLPWALWQGSTHCGVRQSALVFGQRPCISPSCGLASSESITSAPPHHLHVPQNGPPPTGPKTYFLPHFRGIVQNAVSSNVHAVRGRLCDGHTKSYRVSTTHVGCASHGVSKKTGCFLSLSSPASSFFALVPNERCLSSSL